MPIKVVLAERPVPVKSDPFETAKTKLLKNLDLQLTSAKAMLDGKPCPEVKRKWYLRNAEGQEFSPESVAREQMTLG